jgi:CheY-like chemotaxis protein
LRRAAKRLLTLLGCTVTEAANGVEAVRAVKENPGSFDVVLMDMTMPEMDGLAAAKLINTVSPALPVVLSSGYSTLELPPGVRSLAKPWDARRIETLLREITS